MDDKSVCSSTSSSSFGRQSSRLQQQPPSSRKKSSIIWIVDLAGSERSKRTRSTIRHQKEAALINASLMNLMRCLREMLNHQPGKKRSGTPGGGVVPFRESKLTHMFMNHLTGPASSRTSMIVNINPAADVYDETQHVLGYAATARSVVISAVDYNRKRRMFMKENARRAAKRAKLSPKKKTIAMIARKLSPKNHKGTVEATAEASSPRVKRLRSRSPAVGKKLVPCPSTASGALYRKPPPRNSSSARTAKGLTPSGGREELEQLREKQFALQVTIDDLCRQLADSKAEVRSEVVDMSARLEEHKALYEGRVAQLQQQLADLQSSKQAGTECRNTATTPSASIAIDPDFGGGACIDNWDTGGLDNELHGGQGEELDNDPGEEPDKELDREPDKELDEESGKESFKESDIESDIDSDEKLGVLSQKWEDMFSLLERYKQREGHCKVPRSYKIDEKSLGIWLETQRQGKKEGKLDLSKEERLEKLGVVWNPLCQQWEDMFSLLEGYKEREGDCNVPLRYKEDGQALGRWLDRQRQCKKKDLLDPRKEERLEKLGVMWNPSSQQWEAMFSLLEGYKLKEGHCNVPGKYKEDGKALGKWLDAQRQGKKKDLLDPSKKERLEKLGVVWNPSCQQWEDMFSLLERYKEREGHCNVPHRYKEDGRTLGQWLYRQRQFKKEGNIDPSKEERLEKLGVVWNPSSQQREDVF